MDEKERKEQHLATKIENLLSHLFNALIKNEYKNIKEKFVRPEKDEDDGLFVFDEKNPFYLSLIKSNKTYI